MTVEANFITEVLPDFVYAGTTAYFQFEPIDETGEDIVEAELSTLTLTYYDVWTEQIINGRSNQNAFDANEIEVVTEPGAPITTTVTWEMQPNDTVIVSPWKPFEYHAILFRWSWDNDTKFGAYQVYVAIKNLPYEVP